MQGNKLREELTKKYEVESKIVNEEETYKSEQKFKEKTAKLHYLVSTTHIKGVFNPSREKLSSVVIQNQPLEHHIKQNGKIFAKTSNKKYYSYLEQKTRVEAISSEFTLPPISPPKVQVMIKNSKQFLVEHSFSLEPILY